MLHFVFIRRLPYNVTFLMLRALELFVQNRPLEISAVVRWVAQ